MAYGLTDLGRIFQDPTQISPDHLPVIFHDEPVKIPNQDRHPEHDPAGKQVADETDQGEIEIPEAEENSFPWHRGGIVLIKLCVCQGHYRTCPPPVLRITFSWPKPKGGYAH
jgi:hypothetical protein